MIQAVVNQEEIINKQSLTSFHICNTLQAYISLDTGCIYSLFVMELGQIAINVGNPPEHSISFKIVGHMAFMHNRP